MNILTLEIQRSALSHDAEMAHELKRHLQHYIENNGTYLIPPGRMDDPLRSE